jgi:hypothetical protein
MKEEQFEKLWNTICESVAKDVEKSYMSIPISKRNQLGVEPNGDGKFADVDAYDRNRWIVCYINVLEWQRHTKMLLKSQHVFDDNDT